MFKKIILSPNYGPSQLECKNIPQIMPSVICSLDDCPLPLFLFQSQIYFGHRFCLHVCWFLLCGSDPGTLTYPVVVNEFTSLKRITWVPSAPLFLSTALNIVLVEEIIVFVALGYCQQRNFMHSCLCLGDEQASPHMVFSIWAFIKL